MATELTKGEKRYLKRFICLLCEQTLDKDWCGAIWPDACDAAKREDRRRRCLVGYKPRKKA